MDKKENKNEMLSFDKLREHLGIEGELPVLEDVESNVSKSSDEVKTEAVKVKATPVAEGKTIVENGNTFIDITAQFTNYDATEETVEKPVASEVKEEPTAASVVPKKRIRTFNEIFADFFGIFFPVKADSGKEKVRKLVMDFSIVLIICCLIGFGRYFVELGQQKSQNIDTSNHVVGTDKLNENQYVEAWQEVYAKNPNVSFPAGMNPKFSYLYAENQDLAGWLKIYNTSLDVQIVQGEDNDYYLNRDFYKNSSQYGCPYLDYKNDIEELDDNTIIYGPHMSGELLFSTLDRYKTIEGYKNAPLIEFSTLYKSYTFKVFAAFIASDNTVTDGGFNYAVTDFVSDARFTDFISEVKSRSIFNTDVSVQTDDKIITLVTTSHEFDGARLVVMGRMVRENESLDVNVNSVTLNTSPKYPQAWYDKKGIENPYSE